MRSVSDIGATAPILHSPTHSVLARVEAEGPMVSAANPSPPQLQTAWSIRVTSHLCDDDARRLAALARMEGVDDD
jgi:hypothetical protein